MAKDDFPQEVIDSLEEESRSSVDDGYERTISSLLDETKSIVSAEDVSLKILRSASNNANQIYECVISEEKSKIKWRKFFILFFSALLVLSLAAISYLIWGSALSILVISDELIIALLVYVIANILSILYFMVRYINNNQYLEMFKIVTHKMLDYIIQDKAITANNHNGEQKNK